MAISIIYVANDSAPQFLFKNKGDGTFVESGLVAGVAYTEDAQTFAGMGTDFADLNDDGNPDIVTTASARTQHTLASTASSYLSTSDGRVFLGIGQEKSIIEIRIMWPDGLEQVIPNPAVNQILKVDKASPAAAPARGTASRD